MNKENLEKLLNSEIDEDFLIAVEYIKQDKALRKEYLAPGNMVKVKNNWYRSIENPRNKWMHFNITYNFDINDNRTEENGKGI